MPGGGRQRDCGTAYGQSVHTRAMRRSSRPVHVYRQAARRVGGGRVGKLLEPIIEKAEGAPMGMLHRVMVYRSYALYCRSQGDTVGLETWGSRALALAEESGLEHQARTIQSDVLGREAFR